MTQPGERDIRLATTKHFDGRWNQVAGGPPVRLLKRGDLAVIQSNQADNDKKVLDVSLDELPLVMALSSA